MASTLARVDWDLGPATSVVLLGFLVAAGLTVAVTTLARPSFVRAGRGEQAAEEVTRWLRLRRFLRRRLDPAQATGLALTIALAAIFGVSLLFGVVADMITTRTGLARLDASAAAWGSRHATPSAVRLFHLFTLLGSTPVIVAEVLVVGLADRLRRRRWAGLAFLVTVAFGQNLLANGIKLLFHRARPPVPHLTGATGYSFPSGHSAAAAATYAAIALLLASGRRWPVKVWLATAAAAVTAAVATSRVLLGVHWLTDVIGGVNLGLGWFAVCSIAFGGPLLRFGAPAERAEAADRAAARGSPGGGPGPGPVGLPASEPSSRPERRPTPMRDEEPQPTDEQVESRAGSLAAEPGNPGDDTGAQARALLEESEERVEDPAARDPDDPGVIRRTSDEGVTAEE
jgi:membrane-associated phospholipid phosphatase